MPPLDPALTKRSDGEPAVERARYTSLVHSDGQQGCTAVAEDPMGEPSTKQPRVQQVSEPQDDRNDVRTSLTSSTPGPSALPEPDKRRSSTSRLADSTETQDSASQLLALQLKQINCSM